MAQVHDTIIPSVDYRRLGLYAGVSNRQIIKNHLHASAKQGWIKPIRRLGDQGRWYELLGPDRSQTEPVNLHFFNTNKITERVIEENTSKRSRETDLLQVLPQIIDRLDQYLYVGEQTLTGSIREQVPMPAILGTAGFHVWLHLGEQGLTTSELRGHTGLAKSTISTQLSKLRKIGLAVDLPFGRYKRSEMTTGALEEKLTVLAEDRNLLGVWNKRREQIQRDRDRFREEGERADRLRDRQRGLFQPKLSEVIKPMVENQYDDDPITDEWVRSIQKMLED